jgi:hypothetical protein
MQMFRIHRPHPSGLPNVVARGNARRRTVRVMLYQVQVRTAVRDRYARSIIPARGVVSHIASSRLPMAPVRVARDIRRRIVAFRVAVVDVVHISRMDGATECDTIAMGMGIDQDGYRGGSGNSHHHRR